MAQQNGCFPSSKRENEKMNKNNFNAKTLIKHCKS